jgi:phage FluMu protein Com
MGGIVTTGIAVKCDRCKKTVAITDEKQAEFYRAFASRPPEKADERMFVAILNRPDGSSVEVDFEFVCPKCADANFGYLTKIDTALAPEKPAQEPAATPPVPETVPTPEPAPAPEPAKPPKAAKGGKKVDVKVEPPPAPPADDKPGVPYTDDDLFT